MERIRNAIAFGRFESFKLAFMRRVSRTAANDPAE
jgi:hypothetical protein